MIWNDRIQRAGRFLGSAFGRKPTPKKTVFDCIGPDGKITDEGWRLLRLDNPHKKKYRGEL